MSGLQLVGAKEVGPLMFLNQFPAGFFDLDGKDERFKRAMGLGPKQEATVTCIKGSRYLAQRRST
jgi:hypothetical protein